ncbi:hypothetical protein ONZ45_g15986 [Pleurotus djamor]|nr:hypothetical protein ONZ45_g15986 [Pleurotus djamor]
MSNSQSKPKKKESKPRKLPLYQNLLDNPDDLGEILYDVRLPADITEVVLPPFTAPQPVGISATFSATGEITALALVAKILKGKPEREGKWGCLVVDFSDVSRDGDRLRTPQFDEGIRLLQTVLARNINAIYAFDMAPIALSLYADLHLHVSNGVDIQSAFPKIITRSPLAILQDLAGDQITVHSDNVQQVFDLESPSSNTLQQSPNNLHNDLIMRAWAARIVPDLDTSLGIFEKAKRMNFNKLSDYALDLLAKVQKDALCLEQQAPLSTSHQFQNSINSNGRYVAVASDYKHKFHRSQSIQMAVKSDHGDEYILPGSTGGVTGRSAQINTSEHLSGTHVTAITSLGRGTPTNAQRQRAQTVRTVLQGEATEDSFFNNPFIQNIFLHPESLVWPVEWHATNTSLYHGSDLSGFNMNASQNAAIHAMLSPNSNHHLVLIQGPPGTGKTSVIANFAIAAQNQQLHGIWLVAQSNMAVKNIAEKLVSYQYTDFRLLVSKDFRFEWHDHLYRKLEPYIIQSDEFKEYLVPKLKGARLILCTLSMLANAQIIKFTSIVPLKVLVVDEASQIEIGDYIYAISKFSSLRKICFIGDNKQLPPYGYDDNPKLQSIFEVDHLNQNSILLNIQYRMPPQFGDFISNNDTEAKIAIALATQLQEKDWRYRVVVPYEGQRGLIEKKMKEEGLNWEDKCFNVDSFQGNEDDYIIITLVRTTELGFLKSLRRTNVMLTRFKRKMFIITNKVFLDKAGAESLVGKLAEYFGESAWLSTDSIEKGII